MADKTKFLDEQGLKVLWEQIKNHQGKALVEELANYTTSTELEEKIAKVIKELPSAIQFKGVVEDPAEIAEPRNGDIIFVGTKEYVYSETITENPEDPENPIATGEWRLFGDESVYATKDELTDYEPEALSAAEILAICSDSNEKEITD